MIPFSKPVYYGNERKYLLDAFDSTWISEGKYNKILEDNFKYLFNVEHALLTSNGTSAIQLAYLSLELKPGDEVIVPAYCFQACANVARELGLVPVFADVDLVTWLITPETVEPHITNRTKAIVAVDNYGYVCDVPKLRVFGIPVIEDVAEAIFSKYPNSHIFAGAQADIGTFSFHATKTITTGEGGMLITNSDNISSGAELYKSHGLKVRGTYDHILAGNNFRMTNLQAAIGVAQLEHYDKIMSLKRYLSYLYRSHLEQVGGISLPKESGNEILWSFPLLAWGYNAEWIIKKLKFYNIEARPGFKPAWELGYLGANRYASCSELSQEVVVLPLYTSMTNDEVIFICNKIKEILEDGN